MSRIVDLTQPLGPDTVLWPGSKPVRFEVDAALEGDGHFARVLHAPEHSGTHLDAPAHFFADGATAERIPAAALVVPCAVLDVRARASADPDFALTPNDLERFEADQGPIEPGCAVLLATGWDAHRDDADRYLGSSEPGALRFPGFGADAARALVERRVVGIGTDTLSVDRGSDADYPVHRTTLAAGLWHLEGLVNLDDLPARGATLFVGALRVEGGSGTPARVIAVLPGS